MSRPHHRPLLERKNTTRYKVGYFVGSLSSTSINRELSQVLIKLAPEELEFTEIPIDAVVGEQLVQVPPQILFEVLDTLPVHSWSTFIRPDLWVPRTMSWSLTSDFVCASLSVTDTASAA